MLSNILLFSVLVLLRLMDDDGYHHHVNADELAGIGMGMAAFFGAAGYLLLRRRAKQD